MHHRRSIRLRDYDYSQEGAYFVTICAQDRTPFCGEVSGGEMHANKAGRMVQAVWDSLPQHYPGVDIDVFQLMPNHVHGVILLYAGERDPLQDGEGRMADPTERLGRAKDRTCGMSLPTVVERFKSLTTTRYREGVVRLAWPRFRGRLWQRNYYEHVIRDEDELNRIRQYIIDNPINWEYDQENPVGKESKKGESWEV